MSSWKMKIVKINTEKVLHRCTLVITCISLAWAILPMLILQENYVFTIHDGLDSWAGTVRMVHDNGIYFNPSASIPQMNGLERKYLFLSYSIYDFLNYTFGFLLGQIITRIAGVLMAFFSMKFLLHYIFIGNTNPILNMANFKEDMLTLISIAYAITPLAPIRMFVYASLPLDILAFLYLQKKQSLSKAVLLTLPLPLLSVFTSGFIIVMTLWFFFSIIDCIKCKKINPNLFLAFILMLIVTILTNISGFAVALGAAQTNRPLGKPQPFKGFKLHLLKQYLIDGIYFSTPLHRKILLPFLVIATACLVDRWFCGEKRATRTLIMIFWCWTFWFFTAAIRMAQESNIKTGIIAIDGYQWGESIALMRFVWYLMLATIVFSVLQNVPWRISLYCVLCFQLLNIAFANTTYNDTYFSVKEALRPVFGKDRKEITYTEFFSENLFSTIKNEIGYKDENVCAYGFHPSVLYFNGFRTLDGYYSTHSIQYHYAFRSIIAPSLDRYEYWRNYYDTWGGRMYLYGELSYQPTREKNTEAFPLYIDTEAFKSMGGKYILSRAAISNAEELRLHFIKDFDSTESIYHIYVYKAE